MEEEDTKSFGQNDAEALEKAKKQMLKELDEMANESEDEPFKLNEDEVEQILKDIEEMPLMDEEQA